MARTHPYYVIYYKTHQKIKLDKFSRFLTYIVMILSTLNFAIYQAKEHS